MTVWQRDVFAGNGPMLNSEGGMVRWKVWFCWDVNAKEMMGEVAVEELEEVELDEEVELNREGRSVHGMPYVPGSVGLGWMSGEIRA